MRKEEFDLENAELDPEQREQIRELVDMFFPPNWLEKAWDGYLGYMWTPPKKPEDCPIYTIPSEEEIPKILEAIHRKAMRHRFEMEPDGGTPHRRQ